MDAPLEEWDTDTVVAWLETLQLERYAPAFRKYRVDGRRLALGLSEKFMSAPARKCEATPSQNPAVGLRSEEAAQLGARGGAGMGRSRSKRGKRENSQSRARRGGRRAGSNNLASSPHSHRRGTSLRDVASAPAKIRPRNRLQEQEGKQARPTPRSSAAQGGADRLTVHTDIRQAPVGSVRVSSPVSSLRAKQTHGDVLAAV